MTKPTKWLCAQPSFSAAWASAQSDKSRCPDWSESSLCHQWVAKDPSFLHADSEDWSDWVDAQDDLSLRWVHRSFCWFCHQALILSKVKFKTYTSESMTWLKFRQGPTKLLFYNKHTPYASRLNKSNKSISFEPCHKKTCIRGLRPGKTAQPQKLGRGLKFQKKKLEVLYYLTRKQQRCLSDSEDAQADLRLCCSHMAGFLTTWPIYDKCSVDWTRCVHVSVCEYMNILSACTHTCFWFD